MQKKMNPGMVYCMVLLLLSGANAGEWTSSIGVVGELSRLNELSVFTSGTAVEGLGLRWGGAAGIRYSLRKGYIGFSGIVKYLEFCSEGECMGFGDPLSSSTVPCHEEAHFRIVSLALGADLYFFDSGRIQPYFCGHVLINSFGLSRIVVEPLEESDWPFESRTVNDISENIRFGAGFGAGIQVSVLDWLEIGPVVRYEVYNLDKIDRQFENTYDFMLSTRKVSSITFSISVMVVL